MSSSGRTPQRSPVTHLRLATGGVLVAALCASSLGAVAATTAAPAAAAAERQALSAELIKPGLYRISGANGSSLLHVAGSGLVVVDAPRATPYPALMAEVRRLAKNPELPLKALVLTAAGPGQAGNAAPFNTAGVPVIVSQRALARLPALAQPAADTRASAGVAHGRLISYSTNYMLQGGDLGVEIEYVGHGRTAADSVVLFRDLRVLAIGDLYTAGTPEPDCASGGSYAGWASAITHLLWLHFDVAVPSHGAPVGKPELLAFKTKLEELAARSAASGAAGCTLPG